MTQDQWIIRVKGMGMDYTHRYSTKEAAQAEAKRLRAEGFKVLVIRA